MRHVVWSVRAQHDYLDILRHIAADDPDAAERVLTAIETTADNLATYATGHPGRVSGTYEKTVSRLPYIIAYALSDENRVVAILRVIHTARDWQAEDWPR
jgi:toxin ParE1/3/4